MHIKISKLRQVYSFTFASLIFYLKYDNEMKRIPCKVFAPATVSNIGVGYDILGFPIYGLGDEVSINKGKTKGLVLKGVRGNPSIPNDIMKNTAGFAAYKVLEKLNLTEEPIELVLFKNMPTGTGMGSSASSAVAGAFAVNEYLNCPLSKKEVLDCATQAEVIADGSFHADNTAPSLYGGFVLIRDNPSLDVIKLPTILGLQALILYPHIQILTKDSRAILKEEVSLTDHVTQSGNLGGFIASLYKSDLNLLGRSLQDVIIEPQRAHLIPHFEEVKSIAMNEGALGFSISGAGPSMFALCANTSIAESIKEKAAKLYKKSKIELTGYISSINREGAIRY